MISSFFVIFFIFVASCIRKRSKVSFSDAMSVEQSKNIIGIFIILVFLHHIIPYIENSGYVFDKIDNILMPKFRLGQKVVVMFLIYSGYGICESIKNKENYLKSFPKKRILTTLINFDIAVCVFVFLLIIFNKKIVYSYIPLSFIGWESVGNSNWYIFDIIILYSIIYLIHQFINKKYTVLFFTLCTLLMIVILQCYKAEYWYDTIFCFWGGYMLSKYKYKITTYTNNRYYLILFGLIFCYIFTKYSRLAIIHFVAVGLIPKVVSCTWLLINIQHLFWGLCFVWITLKLSIYNSFLKWCGANLFPIYIYQRLPMILIPSAIITGFPIIYILLCFIITLIIAYFYKYWKITLK